MLFSDNALLLISTVLENEGYSATDREIAAALTDMFEGKRKPEAQVGGIELQEGEFYLVHDIDERELEEHSTRTALDSAIQRFADYSAESGYNRDFSDMAEIYICRRRVEVEIVSTTVIK